MPAYLVELPSNKRVFDTDTLVVFAADEAGARSAAAGQFDGDAAALWSSVATVTEIVAGTTLAQSGDGWSAYCRVSDAAGQSVDPLVVEADGLTRDPTQGILGAHRLHIGGVAIDGGGSSYQVDDIVSAAGGTAVRAATFRVTSVSTGTIDGIELVDPGEYTELPSLSANAVTGGNGSGATLDLTQAAVGGYEAILAQMVTNLNAQTDIANAAIDLSESASGARLFTVASGSGGDDLGDGTVEFEVRHNGTAFAPLVSTITDEGSATDALTVAIPASPIAPPRVYALKS